MKSMLRVWAFVSCIAILLVAEGRAETGSEMQAGYPTRPVKVIVPFSPGGVTDSVARLWAQRMSVELGQQFYVENHAGGGSNVGIGVAARQAPDGYALLLGASSFITNPALYKKIPYDPFKDFTPVSIVASTPGVLVVHPSVPANTFQEFVALVRANPGKYSYGMAGLGTPNQLMVELIKLAFGLDIVTVPFPGGGPAVQSTIAGHTPIASVALTSIPALVEAGQLRALAVTGTKRAAVLPQVPTLKELGLPDPVPDTFTGVLAPAGTPKDIVDKLSTITAKVMAVPDVKQQLANFGSEPVLSTPAEFETLLKNEAVFWRKAMDAAKIERQ